LGGGGVRGGGVGVLFLGCIGGKRRRRGRDVCCGGVGRGWAGLGKRGGVGWHVERVEMEGDGRKRRNARKGGSVKGLRVGGRACILHRMKFHISH